MADPVTCPQCNYSGYAPSAAVMLSPGELECPSCDGFDWCAQHSDAIDVAQFEIEEGAE